MFNITKKKRNKKIRKTSLELTNLFTQLAMDDIRFIARSTPTVSIEVPRGRYEIDLNKLAEAPYIRAQKGLEKSGINKEDARKIKDELVAKDEMRALRYLEKNSGLKDAVTQFTAKLKEYQIENESTQPTSSYWVTLAHLAEAIRCYTGKDETGIYRDVFFEGSFFDEIKELKPSWQNTPKEIQNVIISLLKKGYGKNQKIVEEVVNYLG